MEIRDERSMFGGLFKLDNNQQLIMAALILLMKCARWAEEDVEPAKAVAEALAAKCEVLRVKE